MNKQIRPTVYKILKNEKLAREDDNYLILRVVQELEPKIAGSSFISVMFNLKFKKISMESITRARRKFFEENPQYREKEIENIRRQEEENYYVAYSNHIPRLD